MIGFCHLLIHFLRCIPRINVPEERFCKLESHVRTTHNGVQGLVFVRKFDPIRMKTDTVV